MSISSSPPSEPGWYNNPDGGATPEWWNGTSWGMSEYIPGKAATQPAQPINIPAPTELPNSTPLLEVQTPQSHDYSSAPAPTYAHPQHRGSRPDRSLSAISPSTWQIWVIALFPLVPYIASNFLDTLSIMTSSADMSPAAQLHAVTHPAYITVIAGSWVMFIANFFLAYSDSKKLDRRGIPYPFPFGLIFFGSLIYVIGRTSNVKRYTGKGLAPLWASIGVQIVGSIVYVLIVIRIVEQFLVALESLQSF